MLNTLSVWNFALLEQVEVEFNRGLNILTGETGAGKSILIDALGAVLGGKLSAGFIRTGCDWLRVQGVFTYEKQPQIQSFLEENALDNGDGEIIITRQISQNGRGSILINGCRVPLKLLRELGSYLVDVHGQHENLALLRPEAQFLLVDGSDDAIIRQVDAYKEKYKTFQTLEKQLKDKQQAAVDYDQRVDMLRWQLQEIEAANLQDYEDEELEKKIRRMANAERIAKYIGNTCEMLYGGGRNGIGAVSALEEAVDSLHELARFDDALENQTKAIEQAVVLLKEAAYDVRDYGDEMEFDPMELDRLQSRQDVIDKLRKKYGATIADIKEYYSKAQADLDTIECFDEDIEKLTKAIAAAKSVVLTEAKKLTQARRAAAAKLSRAIEGHLYALGMPDARFYIDVKELTEDSLLPNGQNVLEMMFSGNLGQEPKPIAKVASGGELSRIALAIKTMTAFREDSPPSMVFDEIDTGIGGKTAQMVAERIAMVAAGRQVLCITHLPQIACMSDVHLYISKQAINGKTNTYIRQLSEGERVNEIARMASGADVTAAYLDNAREMLERGRLKKAKFGSQRYVSN